jgi:cell division protein FtsL
MSAVSKGYKFRERTKEFDFRHGLSPLPAALVKPEAKPVREKSNGAISAWDKGGMLLLLLFAGLVGIGMILASAWTTSIKYEINQVERAVETTYAEIEKLTVQIEKASGINVIELRATRELGMIYPTAEQVVYIEEEPTPMNDFAQYIKENAYQLW